MGWIWALAVVGSLIGAGAIADRRRYRGLPVPPELTGRAKRHEDRLQRARMEHLQASIRYSPFTTAIAQVAPLVQVSAATPVVATDPTSPGACLRRRMTGQLQGFARRQYTHFVGSAGAAERGSGTLHV